MDRYCCSHTEILGVEVDESELIVEVCFTFMALLGRYPFRYNGILGLV